MSTEMADDTFREVAEEVGKEGEAFVDMDLLKFYGRKEVDELTQADYKALLSMVHILWHSIKHLEQQIDYTRQEKTMAVQANGELISLMTGFVKQIRKETKSMDLVRKIQEEYNGDFKNVVADVTLNGETFSMTRCHFRQLMLWYCNSPKRFFSSGDIRECADDNDRPVFKFTLGEIVKRRSKGEDSEYKYDEVIIFEEREFLCDVITMTELRRAGTRSDFTETKFVWIKDLVSLDPKRYFLDKDSIESLISGLFVVTE